MNLREQCKMEDAARLIKKTAARIGQPWFGKDTVDSMLILLARRLEEMDDSTVREVDKWLSEQSPSIIIEEAKTLVEGRLALIEIYSK